MFQIDVAKLLTRQLPFRKKNVFWGESVIEWAAVIGTTESAFLMSVALGISPSGNGQKALSTIGTGFLKTLDGYIADNILTRGFQLGESGTSSSQLSYRSAYADVIEKYESKYLVTELMAEGTIMERIVDGLIVGVKCSGDANHLVSDWVSPNGNFSAERTKLGIGGLSVETPRPSSVSQAIGILDSTYEEYEKYGISN